MLIIEGADLVGKTTLAKALTKQLNELGWPHVYQHLSRLPTCWREKTVGNYSRLMNAYAVRDRFHMSEPLYAAARGEEPMLSPGQYRSVDEEVKSHGGYIIVVTADPELIERRYAEHAAREMYSLDKVLEVNEGFVAMANGGWDNYVNPLMDLHVHCTQAEQWPALPQLRAYTARLAANFPYPGARAA